MRWKAIPCALLAAAIAAFLMPVQAVGAEITVTYRFESPDVRSTGDGFTQILFPKTVQGGRPGEPSYPFRGVSVLLPPGESVRRVDIERRGWTLIAGDHKLYPRQHPVPGIGKDGGGRFIVNDAAYEIDRWVQPPSSSFSTRHLRGHSIAVGSFCPVGYHPASRTVGYYSEVSIRIETGPDAASAGALVFYRGDGETRRRVTDLVDNDHAISGYDGTAAQGGAYADEYEYLIITNEDLEDDFSSLCDFYTRLGMRTRIMTIEDIVPAQPGIDRAEKVRNAIIEEYTDHGITHVLLGGDSDGTPDGATDLVPRRGFFCQVYSSYVYEDEAIPADLYFAALDGSWNDDGDTLWGEHGEEDWYSEIAVGRACVDSASEAGSFINKTIMYQESPVSTDARDALLLGEKLYNDPLTYGGDELDQLVGTCTEYGFTTTGMPEDFNITKHYDRDGGWSGATAIGEINAGTNWVTHSGHCNTTYAMRIYIGDVNDTEFTNDGVGAGFPIVYTYGCFSGSFDNDCIGEKMTIIEHCAAAFLGNSRYGWFTEGTTNGPSHHFQREFYDAIFTEGYTTLGAANQRSKDETVPFIDLPAEYEPGAHRWCYYALNLLGDPALDGWTDTPESLSVSHPASINRSDTLLEIETGVEGALAALYLDGTCYGRGTAGPAGHIDLTYMAPPFGSQKIELSVRAHDRYIYRDSLMVESTTDADVPPARLTLEQNVPNPFNPSTVIRFSLPEAGFVDLRVYDVAGREIERLIHRRMDEGTHTYRWLPEGLGSGVYFYVLDVGGLRMTRKAVLLR